jgi:hypothetical protein
MAEEAEEGCGDGYNQTDGYYFPRSAIPVNTAKGIWMKCYPNVKCLGQMSLIAFEGLESREWQRVC